MVGGLASIPGAIYGAIFIQFVPNIADQISKAAPWAIYGVFLIGFMYVMPLGVAGAIRIALGAVQAQARAASAASIRARPAGQPIGGSDSSKETA